MVEQYQIVKETGSENTFRAERDGLAQSQAGILDTVVELVQDYSEQTQLENPPLVKGRMMLSVLREIRRFRRIPAS